MTTILHIKSSSNLQNSATRQIGSIVIGRLKAQHTNTKVIERDLVKNHIPHISPEFRIAMFSNNDKELMLSNQLIDEVFASDIIVIEAPMYNFSIPSALKAWIDYVARAHKTFRYTATGAEGLVNGKKAILVLSSGGIYSNGPTKGLDFQETYLRAILGFIGISDIATIRAEGLALGVERAAEAIAKAKQQANAYI